MTYINKHDIYKFEEFNSVMSEELIRCSKAFATIASEEKNESPDWHLIDMSKHKLRMAALNIAKIAADFKNDILKYH